MLQQKDPVKKAELDRQNTARYGTDHIKGRILEMQTALAHSQQAKETFAKRDPAEMDMEKSMARLAFRIDGLALKILSPQVRM